MKALLSTSTVARNQTSISTTQLTCGQSREAGVAEPHLHVTAVPESVHPVMTTISVHKNELVDINAARLRLYIPHKKLKIPQCGSTIYW